MTTGPAFAGATASAAARVIGLLLVAAVPTVLNAFQPLVIDDGVYYLNARHILANPLAPYDGVLRFAGLDVPRMAVLAPPVLPYWWALAMTVVGDSVPLAKLTLYPFAVLLTIGIHSIARRFARGMENLAVALVVLSPWILPSFNFMLDVPALGLGVAAFALYLRSCDRGSMAGALVAGLLAGLAVETKYNMATIPAAMLLYGLFARRIAPSLIAGIAAAAAFVCIEAAIWARHGISHFLAAASDASGQSFNIVRLRTLCYGLIGNTGPLAVALVPVAALALNASARRVIAVFAACAVIMFMIMIGGDGWPALLIPGTGVARIPSVLHLSGLLGIAAWILMVRVSWRLAAHRYDPMARFLVAWLVVEIVGYFVMSPFPATRRLFGPFVVLTLIVCRAAAPRFAANVALQRLATAAVALSLTAGLSVWLIGYVDATNARTLAAIAATRAKAEAAGHRAWVLSQHTVDHYAAQAGLEPIVVGKSQLAAGDVLMVAPPGLDKLHRLDLSALEAIDTFAAGTNLGVTITPDLFWGQRPVSGRSDTRPKAILYRVKAPTVARRMPE